MSEKELLILQNLCNKHNFSYNVFYNKVYIRSKIDSWYFEKKINNKYYLYHESKNKKSSKWHFQREFLDIPYMLKSIAEHDENKFFVSDFNNTTIAKKYAII